MKVVLNACYGGFGLSKAAYEFMGRKWDGYGYGGGIGRTDPKLIECVETLGDAANGSFAKLVVVEIPDDIEWEICDYDGIEWVAEAHREWLPNGQMRWIGK